MTSVENAASVPPRLLGRGSALLRPLGGEAWPPWWKSLTLMFQLEVAERMVAPPGGSAYGRLAVLAQWRSTPRLAMKVHRSAFVPPPKVMSAVVHIVPAPQPAGVTAAAVERDRRCFPALAELAEAAEGALTVIEGDAMAIDEAALAGAHVVANLPYNVGTALLVRWLGGESWPPWWKSLTLMFQQEVAERIVARPGSDAFGRLSILTQWRSEAKLAMKVHRSAFVPPPKVMSAVVHIVPREAPAGVSAACLERITAAAFGQRRKMLRSSLRAIPGAVEALEGLGIDAERRAETLSVEEFVSLARALA